MTKKHLILIFICVIFCCVDLFLVMKIVSFERPSASVVTPETTVAETEVKTAGQHTALEDSDLAIWRIRHTWAQDKIFYLNQAYITDTTLLEDQAKAASKAAERAAARKIFIGDSRTVAMQRVIVQDPTETFICKGAQSYNYFKDTAVPQLLTYLNTEQIDYVYILMGVNDCANMSIGGQDTTQNYIDDINSLVEAYPDTQFCFVSVYHTDGTYGGVRSISPQELNPYINAFNLAMQENCKAEYIPLGEYCVTNGIKTDDGVHIYDKNINQTLHNYIVYY